MGGDTNTNSYLGILKGQSKLHAEALGFALNIEVPGDNGIQ